MGERKCRCKCAYDCDCSCSCPRHCVCNLFGQCESKCSKNGRNLVVNIDGTSNQFGVKNTNVVELHSRILKESPGKEQLTYYISGIGTYVSLSQSLTFKSIYRKVKSGTEMAFGFNFAYQVMKAYRWLSDRYRKGDTIYLFGFSRGAYQVRVLAAMIETVGLLYRGNIEMIPFAYEIYEGRIKGDPAMIDPERCNTFKKVYSWKDVHVHFVGAWDTVSSIGIARGKAPPLTDTADHLCYFRHALALDECRVKFLPEYITTSQKKEDGEKADEHTPDIKEVWFAGSHSDIGGGNRPNEKLTLARIPLLWMENESSNAGLLLEERHTGGEWDWSELKQRPEKSLTKIWMPLEIFPFKRMVYPNRTAKDPTQTRKPNCGSGRLILEGQRIHASLAFIEPKSYSPLAKGNIDWGDILGKGAKETLMWFDAMQKKTQGLLELDIFDVANAKETIRKFKQLTDASPPGDWQGNLIRLIYMSLSLQGAKLIAKERVVESLKIIIGGSADMILRSYATICFVQLCTHDSVKEIIDISDTDILLRNMLPFLPEMDENGQDNIVQTLRRHLTAEILPYTQEISQTLVDFFRRNVSILLESLVSVANNRQSQEAERIRPPKEM